MEKSSFKDALTAAELRQLEQYPDEANVHALIALLRMEGNPLVGSQNLMRDKKDHDKIMIDETKNLRAPPAVNQAAQRIFSLLPSKYEWLEVAPDLTGSNTSGVSFRIKDPAALLKHFEKYKKSDLLNAKLKRSLLEMGNSLAGGIAHTALEKTYADSGRDETLVARTKSSLWGSAATAYLKGYAFDTVCSKHESGTNYKIGEVLKAMDTDAPIVQKEVYRIFDELDPNQAAPQIREILAMYKQDAAKAASAPNETRFGQFFQLVEDIGRTVQALFREREKEALRKKG